MTNILKFIGDDTHLNLHFHFRSPRELERERRKERELEEAMPMPRLYQRQHHFQGRRRWRQQPLTSILLLFHRLKNPSNWWFKALTCMLVDSGQLGVEL